MAGFIAKGTDSRGKRFTNSEGCFYSMEHEQTIFLGVSSIFFSVNTKQESQMKASFLQQIIKLLFSQKGTKPSQHKIDLTNDYK